MPTLQDWISPWTGPGISQSPANPDVPLKARACGALRAVLTSKSRPARPTARLMARGAERC